MRWAIMLIVGAAVVVGGAAALAIIGLNAATAPPQVAQSGGLVNPNLDPMTAVGLSAYLAANYAGLTDSADPLAADRTFEVQAGANAADIADELVSEGFITDAALFRRYLSFYGLDRRLEAGIYALSPRMTIPEVAVALTDAEPIELTLRIPEGWRREQLADWINDQPALPFSGADFLLASAAAQEVPPGLVGVIPPGQSLEGFLYPDTYRIAADASAQEVVQRLLATFDARVDASLRQQVAARGLTLYEVVTLASIVEREAAVPAERPRIAGVYLNRLAIGMRLEADPTVQYAQGYQPSSDQWWNLNLTQADYSAVISPYNTYLNIGLPPGPIASPSLSSIQAVIAPEDSPYLFFRAACDGSGLHNFAVTFEEHLANACP